eukprot:GHVQ01015973.1.p1 GENE.GHVQ01015973.1~~GHVQ01015973.1.p1  ORF type:complete len:179 (+),score=7.26 GHVQ01015973.1:111-647(+)
MEGSNSKQNHTYAQVVRYMSLVAGFLTLILGFISICARHARLTVIEGKFALDDTNKYSWRFELFSFVPSVFIDVWTPFVFGMVTVMVNFNGFNCNFITQNFGRLFLWLFITAMFANLGYAGGIGIIFGSYTLVVTLLALIANFICDGPACLEFAMPNSLEKIAHTISPNENNKTAGEV